MGNHHQQRDHKSPASQYLPEEKRNKTAAVVVVVGCAVRAGMLRAGTARQTRALNDKYLDDWVISW